jgi:hypothetical protein
MDNTQHVFHRALTGEVHGRMEGLVEIWWRPGEKPGWGDLFGGLGDVPGFAMFLACHVVDSEHTQHVFYEGTGHPSELWWHSGDAARAGDLSEQAGQPNLFGSALASHVFVEEGTQHVFFTASGQINGVPADGHIGEFWWRGSDNAQVVDLTERAGGAPAPEPEQASRLASHVVEGEHTPERSQHVFYHSGRDIFELRWGTDAATTLRNLTASSAGENEPAAGPPASHVDPDGTQHVFYVADNAHVIELTWQGDHTTPVARDLTAHSTGIGPAPLAITPPASHRFPQEGTQHVYYIGENHHVTELWWWPGGDPHHEDLTVASGDTSLPSEYWRPTSHVFVEEGTQHVFYTSSDAEMIELWWQP